jgi:hypothetical protein
MKQIYILVTTAIVLATLLMGCANDDFQETSGICPVVIDSNPSNSAINTPLNQVITVTFNDLGFALDSTDQIVLVGKFS